MAWSLDILNARAHAILLASGRVPDTITKTETRAVARELKALIDEASAEMIRVAEGWKDRRTEQGKLFDAGEAEAVLNEAVGLVGVMRVRFGLAASTPREARRA